MAKAKTKNEPKGKAASRPKAKSATKAASKPKAKAASKPKARAASKPKAKAASKPKARAASKPKARAASKPKAKAASRPKIKTTAKAASRPGSKSAPKAASRPKAKPAAKTASRPKAKSASRAKGRTAKTPRASAGGDRVHEALRQRLTEQRQDILDLYHSDLRAGQASTDEGTDDIVDRANNSYNREFLFSLSNNERHMLTLVDEALARMEAGEYGRCTNCSQVIGPQRLEAVPWARFCIACQELKEKGLLEETD